MSLTYDICGLVEAMWVQKMVIKMLGTFMPMLFMIRVWKCHLDTWLCPRIILTYDICGLVKAKEV